MILRLRYRLGIAASLLLLAATAIAQDNLLRVELDGRSSTLGAFRRGTVRYVSLSDVARLLSIAMREDAASRKVELVQPPFRVRLAAGNPFITILETSNRQTIHQLTHEVVQTGTGYFVPVAEFAPLLETLTDRPTAFDQGSATLRIGGKATVRAYDIPSIRLEQKSNGMLIRIAATRKLSEYESWLKKDGWLYVTIAGAKADTAAINAVKPEGIVRRIVAIQSPTSVQLTFRLAGTISATEVIAQDGSNDLLVTIHSSGPSPQTRPTDLSNHRDRWKLDVIVLDAGHGGHDPGTVGIGGVREKDVTLGITLRLGRLIKKHLKDVKVVYTRTDDRFIELYRRGQIANEADGKLFISIHCNSMPRKPHPTRGFEVYLLRPGRTEEAIAIAERENAVIELEEGTQGRYQELTEENFILVAMAQSAHMRSSETFADLTQQEMEKTTGLENRGVRQAGFYVLVGASMPNVLIETGYLSNKEEARYLTSDKGQQRLAESIFAAISRYKQEYEKLLMEGKDLGDTQ